jgi:uncharacterized membrane protein YcaP (DUF421 family)
MEPFSLSLDWHGMFMPDTPLLEIFIRGSVMYLALYFILRFVLKRQAGAMGVSDLLVIVLIADASQNAMAGDHHSLADGVLLVATLIFWNFTLEWLGYNFAFFEKLLSPEALPLVKNGRMIKQNMKKEFITEEDLMSQLRQQGVDDVKLVKTACLEGDGKISVVTGKPRKHHKAKETAI